jgi:hypothetical protein
MLGSAVLYADFVLLLSLQSGICLKFYRCILPMRRMYVLGVLLYGMDCKLGVDLRWNGLTTALNLWRFVVLRIQLIWCTCLVFIDWVFGIVTFKFFVFFLFYPLCRLSFPSVWHLTSGVVFSFGLRWWSISLGLALYQWLCFLLGVWVWLSASSRLGHIQQRFGWAFNGRCVFGQ